MQIKNKNDLITFVNAIISNKKINDASTLKKIREKTQKFILSKGDIFPNSFLELFENFQDTVINSDEKITKQIKFFTDYYSNASVEEKFILNNLIFGLEILNGNAKEGLKNFIKRTFEFNLQANSSNEYVLFAINFILNVKTNDSLLIEIVKEIINPKYFSNKNSFAKRAYFVNFLSILWNNPVMTNNKIWLDVFDNLTNLMDFCRKMNLFEEHMYIQFFTYHIYGNNIQTIKEWKKFNEKVEIPASKFYQKYGKLNRLSKPKKRISTKKKKIGFIIDRIIFNSPYMVMYSFWKNLMKNEKFKKNYEIYIYSLNYVDKQFENQNLILEMKKLGLNVYSPQNKFIEYGFYYPHIQKALDIREKIIKDKIDYLITMISGYDINNFLIANRSAPKQIYWSHGNCVFDILNIDKRISHFPQKCQEFKWELFSVPTLEKFLIGNEKEKKQGLAIKKDLLKNYGENTVFLGTIGRLIKLENEKYLKILAEIMAENPNTVYLACGSGNREKVKNLMNKVKIDLKRVVFTGLVNPHIFGWVIDIWINTYPLIQGQSQEEYFAKKNGVILESKNLIDSMPDNNINLSLYNLYFKEKNIDNKTKNRLIQIINDISNTENKFYWKKTINYLINEKIFYDYYKWIIAKNWEDYNLYKQKQMENFINILKDM